MKLMDGQQIPKSHKEALKPHVVEGESVKAVHTRPMEDSPKSEVLLVTDRRFFRIRKGEEGADKLLTEGRDFETVEMINLESVSRAKMDFLDEEPVPLEEVVLGAVVAIFAVPVFLWGRNQPNPMDQIAVIGSLILFVVGFLAIANAFDTDDGSVYLQLETTDGGDRSVELPEGRKDFAETVINEVGD